MGCSSLVLLSRHCLFPAYEPLTCAEFSCLLSQFSSMAERLLLVGLPGSSGDAGLSLAMMRDPDPGAAISPS